jgi:hypothetical protein
MIWTIGHARLIYLSLFFCGAAAAIAAARLAGLRLVGIYRAFFFYLLLITGVNLSACALGIQSHAYAWVYLFGYPVILIASALLVRDLSSQIFANYPGIAMLGVWGTYLAVGIAVLYSTADWGLASPLLTSLRGYLPLVELLVRGVTIGLSTMLVILLLILWRYPIDLHQNVFTNCVMFSAILLSDEAVSLVGKFTNDRYIAQADAIGSLFGAACFLGWCFLLSRQGEIRVVRMRTHFLPGDEIRLLHQLDAFNSILARAARK